MDLLCQYSGSDLDADKDDEDEPPPAKAKKMEEKRPSNLLPVPEQIQTMFCSKPDGSPTPASAKKRSFHQPLFRRQKKGADYQGRVRSFAHAHGNWATCIFAELKRPLLEDLAVLQTRLHQAANSDDIKIQPELHLSLSRTVTFPIHWIEPFLQRMSKEVGLKVPSRFPLFWSQELQVFVNDEKTRTFVGLCIEHSDSPLKKIVEIIDKEFAELKLPPFYDPPKFHVSLLWTLGDKEDELMRVLPDLNRIVEQCFNDGTLDDGDGFGQSVERIICKSGDKKYLIDCAGTENEIIEYQKNF